MRHRFLWRLRAPIGPGEVRRIERWLASARVFLALSAMVAIWRDPGAVGNSVWASGLLAFYIAQGVFIIFLLRRRQESTPSFRLLVHSADVVWPALILTFTTGQSNTFFLFFVFVLAAAAYRWGLWETVGTAAAAVALLWIESFVLHLGFADWINRILQAHHWPVMPIDAADFEPQHLFMRSIYLLVMGLLLGYLAEQQKQLRAEKAVIARILGRARVETGLTGTLQEIAAELLSMYGATSAVLASQEANNYRVFLGEIQAADRVAPVFHWLDSSPSDRDTYLAESPAHALFAWRRSSPADPFRVVALDENGDRLRNPSSDSVVRLAERRKFSRVMSVSFIFGREWWGRLFLFDPTLTGDMEEELRFLEELVRQVGQAVYNVYLLRRLRMRAGALERARFARELHDGAVQSLIAVEMQVDVLRRQAGAETAITSELGRIQSLLREEVLKLRELMQQMKAIDVDAEKLLPVLRDTVERFQRETGIQARFVTDLDELDMPQRVCRELLRIVQEGLVNVRKHSGARHALVRLASSGEKWNLTVEDDGKGFPFEGRYSQQQMEEAGKGPMIIRERVRLIAGELTVESSPGQGTRLEINVPRNGVMPHEF